MPKELLSIKEFCEVTGIGRTRAYQLLNNGNITALKIGRRTFIRVADLNLWLSNQKTYVSASSSSETK